MYVCEGLHRIGLIYFWFDFFFFLNVTWLELKTSSILNPIQHSAPRNPIIGEYPPYSFRWACRYLTRSPTPNLTSCQFIHFRSQLPQNVTALIDACTHNIFLAHPCSFSIIYPLMFSLCLPVRILPPHPSPLSRVSFFLLECDCLSDSHLQRLNEIREDRPAFVWFY